MLVEDDNNLREIYEARLLAEGYEIVSAKDGEEALALAVKEKPDLIISDVMMPKISGFDMLDILRSTPETKNTKVIMMTALSQAEDKARADKLGADRYLVKSQVTLEDVAKVAREVLNNEDSGFPSAARDDDAAPAAMMTSSAEPVAVAPAPSSFGDVPVAAAPVDEPQGVPAAAPAAIPEPVATPPVSSPPPTTPVAATGAFPQPVQAPEPTVAAQYSPATDSSIPTQPPTSLPPVADPSTPAAPAPDPSSYTPLSSLPMEDNLDQAEKVADEKADIEAQINDFVSNVSSVEPPAPPVADLSTSPEAPAAPPTASTDGADALDDPSETSASLPLEYSSAPQAPEPIAPVPQPDPVVAPTPYDNGQVARKVIEPIGDFSKGPDLNDLLAKEQAKEAAQEAGQSVINQQTSQNNNTDDPSTIAL